MNRRINKTTAEKAAQKMATAAFDSKIELANNKKTPKWERENEQKSEK